MSQDCLFCKISNGDIPSEMIYQDDEVFVIKDLYPKADVHLLVIPRLHIASLEQLETAHDALLGRILRRLPELAREQGLEEGFRTIINTGKGSGQEIFHLHIHLMGGKRMPGFA
ncbi:histidine triad nucleotide-binding protein [Candidatus Venteria ishoeyi]|uniref:HIT-like protein n=1 Tax=Candidatus Venteria ishoeyi TaxID=1899563 RepID=A0A1H6FFC4_9GAMM|nr:histidine triad nucleotide-binding protein [Candidatus Venteria ishoeyi]MDM8547910.1 histidine triad nucleotide-binding protein [Candidatus Venteria ishoeyi]SEH08770.1 HIT-like protein [Candidatus Venteria ishoeyi]